MPSLAIVWMRNDLRVHDHEVLSEAIACFDHVLPVYCFDPRQFATTSFGFEKTAGFRAQFLLESLASLRCSLQELGGQLLVCEGEPESIIPRLCERHEADAVWFFEEATDEELRVERALQRALDKRNIGYKAFWGSTLLHIADLPMHVSSVPDVFTVFRKRCETVVQPREVFPIPARLSVPEVDDWGMLPTLEALGVVPREIHERAALPFAGGEREGLARVEHYFWNTRCLQRYQETRNGLLGADFSGKFSPWLANGSLSPREIYRQVRLFEDEVVKNKSTYWMIFELLWRDFFRFTAKKLGNALFHFDVCERFATPVERDWERFERWATGRTGIPFVDANMVELNETGFMSNRGRQNVASFLVKDLCVPWTLGAEYFESMLIDYDVCSNYGNWQYVAGVGSDPRKDRYFNVLGQGLRYDPAGTYVRHWLPALASLEGKQAHMPFFCAPDTGLIAGYPAPFVLPGAFRKYRHS